MNLLRRKRITLHVVDQISKQLNNPLLSNPDFIWGLFDGVCKVLKENPSEKDKRRIFEHVYAECQQRQWRAAALMRQQ
jgi:hypothetical protein